MQVGELGEFGLIDALAQAIDSRSGAAIDRLEAGGFRLRVSVGDDAAAWDAPAGTRVLTTDTLVEGMHFTPGITAWTDLGWKAVAVNLSDVAAMGCAPLYSVVTLGLRDDLPVDGILEMYGGILDACESYGGAIVGGDVVRSPTLFVTVAMVGAGQREPLTRTAASPGDQIAVTGTLGGSAGGLRMVRDGRSLDATTAGFLARAHSRPTPRIAEGQLLARSGVKAAIDVSDGLVADLSRLCEASDVGAVVRSELVPVDEHLRRAYPDEWLQMALTGGEDYELLFTAPPDVVRAVATAAAVPVTVIGDVVADPRAVVVTDEAGTPVPIGRGGWDHFRSR